MNAFSYGKCWNFGKMLREKVGVNATWDETVSTKEWSEFVAHHSITEHQLFYIKRGFDGLAFEESQSTTLDDEIFPFGAFKGKRFRELSPKYLLWLSLQDWLEKWPTVALYVKQWKQEQEKNTMSKEEIREALKLE